MCVDTSLPLCDYGLITRSASAQCCSATSLFLGCRDSGEEVGMLINACKCRLAGYAGSASLFSYSSGHTLLERRAFRPRAAGQLDCHVGQAPLVASHQALKSAVALCQRHSLEASQDTAHHLWFQLLQVLHRLHCCLAFPASPCPALPCTALPCPTLSIMQQELQHPGLSA